MTDPGATVPADQGRRVVSWRVLPAARHVGL